LDFHDDRACAEGQGGQRLRRGGGHGFTSGLIGNRFDQDAARKFVADAEAGIADETNQVGVFAQEFDALLLAETEFAQPVRSFGRRRELLDADHRADLNLVERTQFFPGTFTGVNCDGLLQLLHAR
jgi:hypothetical protein